MCFGNQIIDESDFLHFSKNMIVLNSFSSRLICQFNSFHEDINLINKFKFDNLKSKAFDGIYFKFYPLEFCWQKESSDNINNIKKLNNNITKFFSNY